MCSDPSPGLALEFGFGKIALASFEQLLPYAKSTEMLDSTLLCITLLSLGRCTLGSAVNDIVRSTVLGISSCSLQEASDYLEDLSALHKITVFSPLLAKTCQLRQYRSDRVLAWSAVQECHPLDSL